MATSNTSSAPKPAESPIKNTILIVVALVALGVVLAIKMGIEETQMAARHPGYTGYVRSTKRIVPFIW